MIGKLVDRVRDRVRGIRDLGDPEERIEGTGEPHLDPAYNGRYTAERRLRALSNADEGVVEDPARESGESARHDGQRP